MYIIHASVKDIPADSGLRRAPQFCTIHFKLEKEQVDVRSEIFRLLRPMPWLASVDDKVMMAVVKKLEHSHKLQKIRKGKKLVQSGSSCHKVHVVVAGVVVATYGASNASMLKMVSQNMDDKKFVVGDSFGQVRRGMVGVRCSVFVSGGWYALGMLSSLPDPDSDSHVFPTPATHR
jgi:hypothetical protein